AGLAGFDLVVVDEASQVRVAEASVPAHLVTPAGRQGLAGDDLQPPPIVQGVYPEGPRGEPGLHRPAFEGGRAGGGGGGPVVAMVAENPRLNDVLTSFAAALLYGPDYACFDDRVRRRRLRFQPAPQPADPLLAACLDPKHPLVVVIL